MRRPPRPGAPGPPRTRRCSHADPRGRPAGRAPRLHRKGQGHDPLRGRLGTARHAVRAVIRATVPSTRGRFRNWSAPKGRERFAAARLCSRPRTFPRTSLSSGRAAAWASCWWPCRSSLTIACATPANRSPWLPRRAGGSTTTRPSSSESSTRSYTGIYDPEAALLPGAPLVRERGNTLVSWQIRRGDAETALAAADVVVEGEYRNQRVEHTYPRDRGRGGLDRERRDHAPTPRPAGHRARNRGRRDPRDLPANKVQSDSHLYGGWLRRRRGHDRRALPGPLGVEVPTSR